MGSKDGGRWRVMFVCNGQSPCPTLYAEEGDIVELTVKSDVYAQSSIHWSGIGHKATGSWNDGTAGISQFPILPRGNFTSVIDTTGSWGLNWLITNDEIELRKIMEAEKEVRHIAIKNHQHRDTGWKMLRMKAEGSEFYCYDSILVNGKGRVHCRQPGFEQLNGRDLDETGCAQPAGLPQETCTPSQADYEVIETEGRPYIMLNLINIGFEHSVVASIRAVEAG
ncbi:multicopper oxidase [Colletotrichum truncatum]|uniref:Multicopper oxidase n=1 Tax=Colletotrichum truncatum TaxID=5467 RepID=A0ACC3YP63_COLTU